jgi:hypothetical protein
LNPSGGVFEAFPGVDGLCFAEAGNNGLPTFALGFVNDDFAEAEPVLGVEVLLELALEGTDLGCVRDALSLFSSMSIVKSMTDTLGFLGSSSSESKTTGSSIVVPVAGAMFGRSGGFGLCVLTRDALKAIIFGGKGDRLGC